MSCVIERLEVRTLLSGISQVGGIGYLPSDNGTTFRRYDITNERWLTPVSLSGSPGGATASLVDADGIYVAYGTLVMRYGLDGSNPTHVMNVPDGVRAIHSDGNLLFLNHSAGSYARLISISKSTNTIIDTMENYVDSIYGSSISTTANRIFGRSLGISPSDITYAAYDDNGMFGAAGDSPYHGDYAGASTTWVFPLGTKVVDDSGGVYAASDLTRLASFGTRIDDIAFVGSDVPVVLSANTLTSYTSSILPSGSTTLARPASWIVANSTNVIAFNADAAKPNRYSTEVVALSTLKTPQPGTPVNPAGLAYEPDKIEIAKDGTLLLLDKETQSVFRWDPQTQQYGATIALVDTPRFMAYSSVTNTLYVAYASGLINQMSLGAEPLAEKPFAMLPSGPGGLATAGPYLFAEDGSGAWATHYTFAPDGRQISAVDWNYYSTEYVWSAANGRMYFFRDDTSPNDLLAEVIGEDGVIGAKLDSPLHTSEGFRHPIRVSPDGAVVILGSGVVHDATTLARLPGGLGNAVNDIAWMQGAVYTVREISGYSQFQRWTGPTFAPGTVVQVPGKPNALLSIDDRKLVAIITPTGGVLQFQVMDADLQVAQPAGIAMSGGRIAENELAGAVAARFTATGANETYVVALVEGEGSADNGAFTISGSELQTAATFDFEMKSSYSIRVRATGDGGEVFEKAFTITVTDVEESPNGLALDNASIDENRPVGTVVGTFSAMDQDGSAEFTFALVGGAGADGNGSFSIVGNELRTAQVFQYEAQSSYSIRVRAMDMAGLGTEQVFTISVIEGIGTPPVLEDAEFTVTENQPRGTVVGTVQVVSSGLATDAVVYAITSGNGTGLFQIHPISGQITTAGPLDYEAQEGGYELGVSVINAEGLSSTATVTVFVGDDPRDLRGEFGQAESRTGPLVLYDGSNGDKVTFSLTGGGVGVVYGTGMGFQEIFLYGTGPDSVLTIKVARGRAGDGQINVSRLIRSSGPLKRLMASGVSVSGEIRLNTDGWEDAPAAKITLGGLNGVRMDTGGMPVQSMQVRYWHAGEMIVPWVGSIGVAGDWQADIEATDEETELTIGAMRVGGVIVGSSIWSAGGIRSITAAGPVLGSRVAAMGNIGAISAAELRDSDVLVGVGREFAGRFAESAADFGNAAAKLGSLTVTGRWMSKWATSRPLVSNSHISAGRYGKLSLMNVPSSGAVFMHFGVDDGVLNLKSRGREPFMVGTWTVQYPSKPGLEVVA